MHSAGLSVFVRDVLTTGLFWQICVLVILLLLLCEYAVRWWTPKRDDMPTSLRSLSIFTIIPFVRNRYDFLNWGFQSTGETVFRFRLLNVRHVPYPSITLFKRCFIEICGGRFRRKRQINVPDGKGVRYPPWLQRSAWGCKPFQFLRCGHVLITATPQIPMIRGVTTDLHGKTIAHIYRRLAMVQTQASLSNRM